MAPKLFKSWWLLVLCGVFDAMISAVYLVRQNSDWPLTYHAWHRTMLYLGWLTLAPGACTIAAGVWNSRKGNSWLLVLNGVACSALGTIFAFWTGPLAFRTIALLIVVMALSIGIYELAISRISRRVSDGTIGVLSIGFALAFLGFVLRWIHLDPRAPAQSLHWLGSYFAFSAICMLALIPGPHRPRLSQFGST